MLRKIHYAIMQYIFGLYRHSIVRYRGEWRYIDGYGNIWRLKPTFRDDYPFDISIEVRG